jgi:UDP-N-acetylmuramate dehydrogenase
MMILGGGSNILFTKDFNGTILKNELKGIELVKEDNDHYYVKGMAGESWHNFVLYTLDKGFTGLENLSLIPGCVGAAPMQNIGAYGVEVKDTCYEVECLNNTTLQIQKFSNTECKFGYRESVFKRELKNIYTIISVTFRLNKKPVYHTTYGAIEQELEKMGVKDLSARAISDAVIRIRQSKLPDPAVIGNAGSFFKNPVISLQQFESLYKEFPAIPNYEAPEGKKIAAGWLIEQCGWKGYKEGDAGVHKLQSLVLVNYDNATGNQVYNLSEKIIQSVKQKFGIELEREVNII